MWLTTFTCWIGRLNVANFVCLDYLGYNINVQKCTRVCKYVRTSFIAACVFPQYVDSLEARLREAALKNSTLLEENTSLRKQVTVLEKEVSCFLLLLCLLRTTDLHVYEVVSFRPSSEWDVAFVPEPPLQPCLLLWPPLSHDEEANFGHDGGAVFFTVCCILEQVGSMCKFVHFGGCYKQGGVHYLGFDALAYWLLWVWV